MTPAVDGVLATHPVVSAIPFFVPTFIVVAVIAVIVWRDRHRDDDEPNGQDGHAGHAGHEEGSEERENLHDPG
ncbi:hypothetical protein [Spirillospora sp. NPDC029432]|uniref:hypothetical protein n=1 Tax=Spirillospora sp. NPDC029432 TaxID=3154599 RepID=UPI0034518837